MKQLAKIYGRVFVTEQLRRRHPKRIDGSESRWDPIRRVGADSPGKILNTVPLDAKFDRRVRSTSNSSSAGARLTRHALQRKARF
jgi:hypothetical protein